MDIIPVVDLLDGRVVHARRGERARYRPIASALCRGAQPLEIVSALLDRYQFQRCYIADLDAIAGGTPHVATIRAILAAFPHLTLWLDHGARADVRRRLAHWRHRIAWVYGSESLARAPRVQRPAPDAVAQPILSLDRHHERNLGPTALWANHTRWPRRVIALNLDRVGADLGPDFDWLAQLARTDPERSYYAGGGVRHRDDLAALRALGICGALVATALHDGRLTAADLHAV